MQWDFLCQKHSSSESSIVWLMIIVWVGDAERIAMKRVQNIFEEGSGLFFQKLTADDFWNDIIHFCIKLGQLNCFCLMSSPGIKAILLNIKDPGFMPRPGPWHQENQGNNLDSGARWQEKSDELAQNPCRNKKTRI